MNSLAVGIAGLGGGAREMIETMETNPSIKISAAADVDPDQLERFRNRFGTPTYSSVFEMCQDPDIDAIYIATPNRFHTEHALAALRHGKHVLMEKPMGTRLSDADTLIDAAEAAGLVLMVSAPHSVEPNVRYVSDIVRERTFGELWAIQSMHYADWLYRPRTQEELNPDPTFGGGVVFRQGPHQLDMIRAIGGGLITSLEATVTRFERARPVPGSYICTMRFENGAVATASYSGYDRFHSASMSFGLGDDVTGGYGLQRTASRAFADAAAETATKRSEGFGGAERGTTRPVAKMPPNFQWVSSGLWLISLEHADIRLTPTGLMIYGEDEREHIEFDTSDQGRHEVIRRFYTAISTKEPPEHDGRWAKATEEVLLAVEESSQTGNRVYLNHQCADSRGR